MISFQQSDRKTSNQFFYIIGDNGSGKSRYLNDTVVRHRDKFDKVLAIPCGIFDRFEPKSEGNYHYLGFKTKKNAVFLSTISRSITGLVLNLIKNGKIATIDRILDNLQLKLSFESSATPWDNRPAMSRRANDEQRERAEGAIHSYKKNRKGWRNISSAAAAALEECNSLNLKFFAKFKPHNYGSYVFPENLSSGYVQKLKMLLLIAKEAENNSLILIDEPEISLHVKWQAELPKLFRDAVEGLSGCMIIVATHSAVIVSNTTQEHDYICNIPENEAIQSDQVEGNIETLLFSNFKYLSLSSHIIPDKCADIIRRVTHGATSVKSCKEEIAALQENELSVRDQQLLQKTVEVIEVVEKNIG